MPAARGASTPTDSRHRSTGRQAGSTSYPDRQTYFARPCAPGSSRTSSGSRTCCRSRTNRPRVKVVAEREEPPPHIARMRYELAIVTDEPEARVELLHRNIQRFGTITNTLAKSCEVSGTIRAVAKKVAP